MSHHEGGQDQQVNYFWHLPSPFQYFRQKQPPALPEQREPFAAAPVPMKDVFVPGVGDLLGAFSVAFRNDSWAVFAPCVRSRFRQTFHCEHDVMLATSQEEHLDLVRASVTTPRGNSWTSRELAEAIQRPLVSM